MTDTPIIMHEQQYQQLTRDANSLRSLVSDDPDLGKFTAELVAAMERGRDTMPSGIEA